MNATSERSIGQIIGFVGTFERGKPETWFESEELFGWQPKQITVDHLLTWLRQQHLTSFHFGIQGDGFYVDWGDDAAHASTLLEALKAAVRAVAS